ncbi:hypothetical protein Dimus_030639 [Dionaea muscipula]
MKSAHTAAKLANTAAKSTTLNSGTQRIGIKSATLTGIGQRIVLLLNERQESTLLAEDSTTSFVVGLC